MLIKSAFHRNFRLFIDQVKNDFYISHIKRTGMEMYIIALVGYLVLFIISTVASRNFNLKSVRSIPSQNTSIDNNIAKKAIIVNAEIVGAK